jgi:hypothetical protein
MPTLTRGALYAFALFLAHAASAASTPPNLEIVSATVDPEMHQASIDMLNRGDKTVVAYTLLVKQFAGERLVYHFKIGFDHMYRPTPGIDRIRESAEAYVIRPGGGYLYEAPTQPEATRVEVSVVSVVNMDRTVEGDPKDAKFVFQER